MSEWVVALAVFLVGAVLGGIAVGLARARAVAALRTDAAAAREALVRRESDLENERKAAVEQRAQSERFEARFRDAFSALSAEALRQNNQSFLDLAKAALGEFQRSASGELEARQKAIGDLVAPVEAQLKLVDAKLQTIEKEREGAYRALRQQVELMATTQDRLKLETSNLVQALRAPSVRGRWGEIHLRRVVELAGMVEHCDFEEQASVETDEGRLRPDLVVHLPGGKQVIVDAKVSLKAYLEAQEMPDGAAREAKLDEHARQIREHIVRLGSKGYWDQFASAPDFVVMFLPGEAFFAAAVQRDAGLLEYGFERNVYAASPATLISLLKAAYYGWQQATVAESARKIRDLGIELHDRLRVMAEHLDGVGSHLGQAVDAFNAAAGSFEHRVLVSARRFRNLGAAGSRDLPELEPVERSVRELPPPDDGESDAPDGA